MLKTTLGTINILLNNQYYSYNPIKLTNIENNFIVDGRYKLIVDVLPAAFGDVVVECVLTDFIGANTKGYIESGEQLALVSFYYGNTKLSMGIEDEIPNINCEYIDCGLKITISKQIKLKQLIFGVAWVSMQDEEKEDVYTWFAADPTLYL